MIDNGYEIQQSPDNVIIITHYKDKVYYTRTTRKCTDDELRKILEQYIKYRREIAKTIEKVRSVAKCENLNNA